MDTKQIMEHQIIICDDLTDQEKFNALEVLETLTEDFAKFLLFESVDEVETLYEVAGDDDIAAYTKYRNKLKKISGQTPVDKTGKKLKFAKKAAKAAKAKGSWGAKIAGKLKGALPKIAKLAKAAM